MTKTGDKKIGRPSIYSIKLVTEICKRISSGESLRQVCKDKDMPSRKTVHLWLLDENKDLFLHQYETACDVRTEEKFDEIEEIAKDESIDVNRARLRVDTRKWYLSKVLPKKYGEKLDVTSKNERITGFNYLEPKDEK